MKAVFLIVALSLFLAAPAFGQEAVVQSSGGQSDVAETLFHHILDGHELELFPFLPPIHLPLGMSTHLFMVFFAGFVILLAFGLALRGSAEKPRGIRTVVEMLVLFVRDDIVYPVMGEERGDRWLPFFTTQFVFLLMLNLLGLIPAFKTATGNLTVTSALAVVTLLLIFFIGFRKLGVVGFFKNMYPEGAPRAIGIFVAALEFFSTLIKSLVLSLRLFANMFAGHLAILSFLVLMLVLSPFFALVSLPFAVFTYALEVLVALIQALVFTLLSCIFISLASTAHEE